MNKISAVIITYNEEKNIERCLQSIAEFVDEIVIVDSFSADATKAICAKYNAIIYDQVFLGFTDQKNFATNKATNNWVLALDADEEVSAELKTEIIKTRNNFDADGYFFNRLNNYCGQWIKHSNWYPDAKIRLFDKNKAKWVGENNIHEVVVLQNSLNAKKLKGDLLHYAYQSHEEHYLKVNKYTSLAAKNYVLNKKKKVSYTKLILNPFWKFFKNYFIHKGFLDGFNGFVICLFAGWATFMKYLKIKELQDKEI